MTTPVWPKPNETQLMPPPNFSLRARRETPTMDTANARMFEHWRTDVPHLTMDRPKAGVKGVRDYMDMNPEASRTNFKSYLQNQPYVADIQGSFGDNPYFQKYDVTQDPRNVVRELRSAVSEDKTDRGIKESQHMLSRQLDNRWIPQGYAESTGLNTLTAYEKLMKPQINDMKRDFRS